MVVPGQHWSQDTVKEFERRIRAGGIPAHVAKDMGLPVGRPVFTRARAIQAQMASETKPVTFPDFVADGDEEEPIEDVLARQRKGFERRQKAATSRKWFPVKVHEKLPYGILWFGDPHIDNGGCNLPLLERHIAVAKQPGIYGANIGDTTDNWPWTGRLARLWAESEVSDKTAKRMAEWFLFDAGVRWLLWLIGNHDEWNGGADFYKRLGATHVPVIDWRAQFVLEHDNGTSVRVDAAHGRKGSSIYNPAHSTLRAAKFGEEADIFVTGHTHNFNLNEFEDADRGRKSWLAQVRGYKWHDHYATVNGFAEYQHGAGILSVIDPRTGSVPCYSDPEFGADVLTFLRSKG
jgi:hypothetical protein